MDEIKSFSLCIQISCTVVGLSDLSRHAAPPTGEFTSITALQLCSTLGHTFLLVFSYVTNHLNVYINMEFVFLVVFLLFVVVSLSLSVYLQCVWRRVVRPDRGERFLHGERCQYAYQTSTRCCKLPPQYGNRTQRSKGEQNTPTFTVQLWFDMFDFNMSVFSLFSQRICSISTLKMAQRS